MDVKNKRTTLGDEAAIYHHEENVSEKEKWKNMTWKQRMEYFRNYYLMKVIVVIACVGIVSSILYTMFSPKPEQVLSVAIINGAMQYDQYLKVQEEFEAAVGLDKETQETVFDAGYTFEGNDFESLQKFAMYNAVGDLDVTILPLSVFEAYAPVGYFSPVSGHLPSNLYARLSEYLVSCEQKDGDGNVIPDSENVYGILLNSSHVYDGVATEEPVVLCINMSTGNDENIVRFLNYIFP